MHDPPGNDSNNDVTTCRHLFAAVVNGIPVCLTVEDRDPWDHDLSAGGMSIWLRHRGPTVVFVPSDR
jgi:hypothetical protein